MAKKRDAYVDTSALIAFFDRSDSRHEFFKRLFAHPPPLETTPLVVAEGHAWVLRKYNRSRARDFLSLLEALPRLTVHSIGPIEQTAAVTFLRRFADQNLTLVDAVGLHIMQRRKLAICWSTDFHLGLTGVALAIHQG